VSLHLVVDHGPLWIAPEIRDRARVQLAAVQAQTQPRVLAFRMRQAGEEQRSRRGAPGVQAGDDPRAGVQKHGHGAAPTTGAARIHAAPGAARSVVPLSPASAGWLLVVPHLVAAVAAAAAYGLAFLLGGVR
jgi:hypothetical protein